MSSSPPPASAASSSSNNTKLPRFIRNQQQQRDRSRSSASYLDTGSLPAPPPGPTSNTNGAPLATSSANHAVAGRKLGRALNKKRSRLLGRGSDSESISKASSSSDRDTAVPSPPPSGSSPSSSPPMILTTPTSPQSTHSFGPRGRNSFQSTRPPSSFDPGIPTSTTVGGVLPSNASIISTSTALHHRLSDIPGRFSGWLGAHFTPPSPNPVPQSLSSSASSYPGGSSATYATPASAPSSQPASAASSSVGNNRHSGFIKGSGAKAPGPIERTLRYVFDPDATPDKSDAPIWLLGTQHPGWGRDEQAHSQALDRSPSQSPVSAAPAPIPIPQSPQRDSSANAHGYTTSLSSSTSGAMGLYAAPSAQPQQAPPQAVQPLWPPSFHASFSSLIYLTYRSHFKPIPSAHPPLPPPSAIDAPSPLPVSSAAPTVPSAPESPNRRWLAWVPGRGELTSDTGWGCMLRTGQMMLANALVELLIPPLPPAATYAGNYILPSLPPPESERKRYEAYVRILVWFLDDPSVLCPFSVHRLALAGAEMGREVGHWFGPSIAAGSIKNLVNAFPPCGLGVVVPPDQVIHETAVFAASHTPSLPTSLSASSSQREKTTKLKEEWGDRAVLVLIGLRLGIDCVNPLYYESIKALFTFPQSMGIAGGRPSSSYYFVGVQRDNLFYLDPHHTRTAVPLRMHTDASQPYDPTMQFSMAEMKTFHCDKVRKMHISGLDPSMLCGFLVRNFEEWRDLRARVDELAKANGKAPIFTIADAPAAWEMQDVDELSDVGMESISSDSMSEEHEFDDPERELTTPTVPQHSRMPGTSTSAVMVDNPDEVDIVTTDELAMDIDSPTDPAAAAAEAEAELDDDWEQTPGPKHPETTSRLFTAGEADMPVMVPFPQDPNPSPSSTRPTSFSATQRERERERERPPAKPFSPVTSGSGAGSSGSNSHGRSGSGSISGSRERVEKKDKLPALPPDSFRERVSAISPPSHSSKQHHHHKHPKRPEARSRTGSSDLGRDKPQPLLPVTSAGPQDVSSPEELTPPVELGRPTNAPGRHSGRSGPNGADGREVPLRRSTGSSQWEKIEVG